MSELMIEFLSRLRLQDLERLLEILEDDDGAFTGEETLDAVKVCIATQENLFKPKTNGDHLVGAVQLEEIK